MKFSKPFGISFREHVKTPVRRREEASSTRSSGLSDATRAASSGAWPGPASITELAQALRHELPAVSKHVRVLERAGLTRRERDGWYYRCHLEAQPHKTRSFLARPTAFWERTLESSRTTWEFAEDATCSTSRKAVGR